MEAVPAASFVALQLSFSSAPPRVLTFPVIIRSGAPVATFGLLNLSRNCQVRRPILTSAGKDPIFLSGVQSMFTRAEDGLRIFFAVLFWMSLFFWGSAWEGRDDDKKKGL